MKNMSARWRFNAPIQLVDGKTRYGLLGVFDSEQGRNLQNGLTRMTLEIQQQHLKRLLGSS
jgi:hypothetical protein